METIAKLLLSNPTPTSIAALVILGLVFLGGKWWDRFFQFKTDMVEAGAAHAKTALDIQASVLQEIRKELEDVTENFNRTIAAQKEEFEAQINELEGELQELQKQEADHKNRIETLTNTLEKQTTRLKEMSERADRWEKKYIELDKQYAIALAKLATYEKITHDG